MEIDVGPNVTSMLERLAEQIGVTADKVFPWYVQQAYLEGVTTLVTFAIIYLVLLIFGIWFWRKADFTKYDWNVTALGAIIVTFITLFVSIPASIEGVKAARQILNPNYYAMKMLTYDIGKMVGK